MTDATEAAMRYVSLHEHVAVLERDKRDMHESYAAKCREAMELRKELERTRKERDELQARCNRYVELLKGDGR